MTFKNILDRIRIGGRETWMPPGSTAEDALRSSGHDPSKHTLVQLLNDGTTRAFSPNERIALKDGDVFDTQLAATGGII